MKNHIHTIPLLDAFHAAAEHGGCPFCRMREKIERDTVAFIMGPAYMEDDVRMETNRVGFCAAHLEKMYEGQNRLGMALMLHTYMQRFNRDIESSKNKAQLTAHFENAEKSCWLCGRVQDTFARYVETYFHLWKSGGEEAGLIESAKGYCVPHFALILREADGMGKSKSARLLEKILPAQQAYMKQMEEDLEWFTLKFDYRNANEPWKNAKDAVPRAINILGGEKHKE